MALLHFLAWQHSKKFCNDALYKLHSFCSTTSMAPYQRHHRLQLEEVVIIIISSSSNQDPPPLSVWRAGLATSSKHRSSSPLRTHSQKRQKLTQATTTNSHKTNVSGFAVFKQRCFAILFYTTLQSIMS